MTCLFARMDLSCERIIERDESEEGVCFLLESWTNTEIPAPKMPAITPHIYMALRHVENLRKAASHKSPLATPIIPSASAMPNIKAN